MPRQPKPIEATALNDREIVGAVPDKPMKQPAKDYVPMSAQQEQDEVVLAFLNNIPDAPDAPTKTSQPSFAASSEGLLELKQELLQKGMSDAEAEEYLRTL